MPTTWLIEPVLPGTLLYPGPDLYPSRGVPYITPLPSPQVETDPGPEPALGLGEGVVAEDVFVARTRTRSALDVAYWASVNIDPLPSWQAPDPATGDLDGTELVEWSAAQVGVTVLPDVAWLADRCTVVTVDAALRTRGAVLLNSDGAAVSLGFRAVTQVSGDRYVLRVVPDGDDTWTVGGLLPGVMYL